MDTIVLESDDDDIIILGEKMAVANEESDDDVIFIPTRRRNRESASTPLLAPIPGPSTSTDQSPVDCLDATRGAVVPECHEKLPGDNLLPTEAELANAVDSITPLMTTDTSDIGLCMPYFFGMDYKSTAPLTGQSNGDTSTSHNLCPKSDINNSLTQSESNDMDSVMLPSAESLGIPCNKRETSSGNPKCQGKGEGHAVSVSWLDDTNQDSPMSNLKGYGYNISDSSSSSSDCSGDDLMSFKSHHSTSDQKQTGHTMLSDISDLSDDDSEEAVSDQSDNDTSILSLPACPAATSISITTTRRQNTTTCTIRQSIDHSNELPDLDDRNQDTAKDLLRIGWDPSSGSESSDQNIDCSYDLNDLNLDSTATTKARNGGPSQSDNKQVNGSEHDLPDLDTSIRDPDKNDALVHVAWLPVNPNNTTISTPRKEEPVTLPNIDDSKADVWLNNPSDSNSEPESDDSVVVVAIKNPHGSKKKNFTRGTELPASDKTSCTIPSVAASATSSSKGALMDQSVSSTTSPVDQQATVLLDKTNRSSLAQHEQFLTGHIPVPQIPRKNDSPQETSKNSTGNKMFSASSGSPSMSETAPSDLRLGPCQDLAARKRDSLHLMDGIMTHETDVHIAASTRQITEAAGLNTSSGSTSSTLSYNAASSGCVSSSNSSAGFVNTTVSAPGPFPKTNSQTQEKGYEDMLGLFDSGDSLPTISGPRKAFQPPATGTSTSAATSSAQLKTEKDPMDLSLKKPRSFRNIVVAKGKYPIPKLVVKIKHEYKNQDWSYYESNSGKSSTCSTTPGTPNSASGSSSPSGLFKRKLPPANIAAIKYHMGQDQQGGDTLGLLPGSAPAALPPRPTATQQDTSQVPFKKRNFGKDMASALNAYKATRLGAFHSPCPAKGLVQKGLQPHSQNPFMSSIIRAGKNNPSGPSIQTSNSASQVINTQPIPTISDHVSLSPKYLNHVATSGYSAGISDPAVSLGPSSTASGHVTSSGPRSSTSGHVTSSGPRSSTSGHVMVSTSGQAMSSAPNPVTVAQIIKSATNSYGYKIGSVVFPSPATFATTSDIMMRSTANNVSISSTILAPTGAATSTLQVTSCLAAPTPSTSQESEQTSSQESEQTSSAESRYTCKHCLNLTLSEEISRCMSWHGCCGQCLRQEVKKLLATNKKGALRCVYPGCDSYYSTTELKRALPPILVEILEEKLDSYAIDIVTSDELPAFNPSQGTPDFGKMETAENNKPGGPRLVRLPGYWEPMDPDSTDYKLVILDPSMNEHIMVKEMFHQTMSHPRAKILKITRVQNPVLYQFYCVKRNQMKKNSGQDFVAERLLFHGTSKDVLESICKNNFDWRLSGKHAAAYGDGTYFARDSSYSHSYTDTGKVQRLTMAQRHSHIRNRHQSSLGLILNSINPPWFPNFKGQRLIQNPLNGAPAPAHNVMYSSNGPPAMVSSAMGGPAPLPTQQVAGSENMMFLAHVLVGNYTLGRAGYRKPPPIDATNPFGKCYDSCVNCMKDPAIYVIFESAQVYPEYIVEYTNDLAEF